MTQSLRVRECFGYHADAVKRCGAFKYGIRAFVSPSADNWLNSCSIHCNTLSSAESVAVCGSRVTKLLGKDMPVGDGAASHAAILIDKVDCLSIPVFSMDVAGAIMFRDAEKVVVLPPVEDPNTLIMEASGYFSGISLPKHQLVKKVFGSVDNAIQYVRKSLLALFLRDLVRILESERREIPATLYNLADENGIPIDKVNDFVDHLKPTITAASIQNEWESVVDALYDRPTIPRGFSILRSASADLMTAETTTPTSRRATKKRSYRDLLKLEMSSGSDSELDSGSQSVKAARSKRKVIEPEPQTVIEFDNWLQCDLCSKWRKVDTATVAAFEERSFTCTDVPGKSCADPSES